MRAALTGVVVTVLAFSAAGARAQQLEPRISPVPAAAAGRTATAPRAPELSAPGSRRSFFGTVLFGAGGAVLGSWAGYMTSQIVWSDWHDRSTPGVNRLRYTLTGAGVGALLGIVVGRHSSPETSRAARPIYGTVPAITGEQIQASRAQTVLELVQLLRPRWLNTRGADVMNKPPVVDSLGMATGAEAADIVQVYLDGEPLGGVSELARIATDQVQRVEYYDMRAATLRWGGGLTHGVINVLTGRGER